MGNPLPAIMPRSPTCAHTLDRSVLASPAIAADCDALHRSIPRGAFWLYGSRYSPTTRTPLTSVHRNGGAQFRGLLGREILSQLSMTEVKCEPRRAQRRSFR